MFCLQLVSVLLKVGRLFCFLNKTLLLSLALSSSGKGPFPSICRFLDCTTDRRGEKIGDGSGKLIKKKKELYKKDSSDGTWIKRKRKGLVHEIDVKLQTNRQSSIQY